MKNSPEKKKIGFYWAASCGGCEIAVLDIDEKILEVVQHADIVFWPVAMDIKYKDVESFEDGYMDVCFFNGGIRTEENEHMAKLLRKKSKILIAFGSCAHKGCVLGFANLSSKEEILKRVYLETPSTDNPEKIIPSKKVVGEKEELSLPSYLPFLKTLDDVVEVDYYIPGCPPPPELIYENILKIINNELPEKKTVLAPDVSLCEDCSRNPLKEKKMPADIKRIYEIDDDPTKCFLEEGVICMGPVTRKGCNTRCINANFPCTGCMGPTSEVRDQGAKMISSLGSILAIDNEEKYTAEEIYQIARKIVDPVGTFYMYSFASSLLGKRK